MNEELYDLIIIGAAAAGCAASVYASRRGLKFAVVTKDIGGEVALSGEVENWPGIIHTTGFELSQEFKKHMESYDPEVHNGWGVEKLEQEGNIHTVHCKNGSGEEKTFRTKTVLVGSGIHPRHLDIPGESELKGMGVTYCTVCDGPLFKGKVTTTIGAGSAAVESALQMSDLAEKVYLITKYKEDVQGGFPKAETVLVDKIKARDNVEIIYNTNTTKVNGKMMVESVTMQDNDSGEERTIETNGVMVHIGNIPNSQFVDCADKSPTGEIIIDQHCATSCKGVYAAGDVTTVPYKQIAIAAGQGVVAALSAIDYINRWEA